jgi:hypothetical protein
MTDLAAERLQPVAVLAVEVSGPGSRRMYLLGVGTACHPNLTIAPAPAESP